MKTEQLLLIRLLVQEYRERHPGCGMAKMYDQLSLDFIGRDKFIERLKDLGLQREKPRTRLRTTIPGAIRWPNLIEGMLLSDINQVWQTDITYFIIGQTHYYMIFIIDVYSKKIISYKVSRTMHAINNIKCLKRAIRQRGLENLNRLIHHSDLGSQFTSFNYMEILIRNNIKKSMGEKGQDNAYAERINGTIKNEYLMYRNIENFGQLKRWTKQAVTHYNEIRIHQHLPGTISPTNFEKKLLTLSYKERPKEVIYAKQNEKVKYDECLLNSFSIKELNRMLCPLYQDY